MNMGQFQLKSFLAVLIFLFTFSTAFPQNGDPPEPPGSHGQTGNQPVGGGAALGSGLAVLVLLGAGYGARKYYLNKKRTLAE
jgi:hypothetical protein